VTHPWLCEARFDDGGFLTITAKWGEAVVQLEVHCTDSSNAMADLWAHVQQACLQAVTDQMVGDE
jgi:hypothetical protein